MGDDPNQRGLSRQHIMHSIDESLRRLGTDYVDLYQIHRFDYETPIEETLDALHDVVKAGKALYIGASSMFAWQFAKMLYTADRLGLTRFVTMQNHYNLVYREEEREMMPLCLEEGIGVIPWSPLARGFLAGNRRKEDFGETIRSKTDEYGHGCTISRPISRSSIGSARSPAARRAECASCPGVDAGAARRDCSRLSVPAKCSISKMRWQPLRSSWTPTEQKALAEPYEVHPVLGIRRGRLFFSSISRGVHAAGLTVKTASLPLPFRLLPCGNVAPDSIPAEPTAPKKLPLAGETFIVDGCEAFLISPPAQKRAGPLLGCGTPPRFRVAADSERWMFDNFPDAE